MLDQSQNAAFAERFRKQLGATVVDNFFRGLAGASVRMPPAQKALQKHEIIRDVPYRADRGERDHLLDVYLPDDRHEGPHPVLLYVHGGGFRILSKETHWLMGVAFARAGYVVFNINYRLAPQHPFPAAIEDACDAYEWVVENAHTYGGDPNTLVVAGESAGGNLALGLTLAATMKREEGYAKTVFDTGIVPDASLVACGMLQVTDWERLIRPHTPVWLQDRLAEVPAAYLNGVDGPVHFADPLIMLEQAEGFDRPLPPIFAPVGTKDPLLEDTRRLAEAVRAKGGIVDERYYVGEIHAFHAMLWRRNAFRCWKDKYRFLETHVKRP